MKKSLIQLGTLLILGTIVLSGVKPQTVALAGIPDEATDEQFDEVEPFSQAKDKNGNNYGNVVKNLNGYGLTNTERHFAKRILQGKGPTGQHSLSYNETMAMYFSIAKKMGLTANDLLRGVNLYEFIRN